MSPVAERFARRVKLVAIAALAAVMLTGCIRIWPTHHPNEAGIPEARAEAREQIAQLSSALRFTDRVTVLGTGERDSCGAEHNWWFDNVDPGYRCWMRWTAVAVIPDAQTTTAVAAAVDDEFEALELPYAPGGAVQSFMSRYPRDRQPDSSMHISTGGQEGSIRFEVQVRSFIAEGWPSPSIASSTHGTVSGSGDTSDITVGDVRNTGAIATIGITFATEYWNTAGLNDLDEKPAPETRLWEQTSWGDEFVVEIADWAPADAQWDACLTDPAVDQASITRVEQPFPYVRLTLLPRGTLAETRVELHRVGECIWATLTSGTLVTYYPYE